MIVRYSGQVRCARCRRRVAREKAQEAGGLLYGSCCISQARAAAAWLCGQCGGLYPEEDMDQAGVCRFCAGLGDRPY